MISVKNSARTVSSSNSSTLPRFVPTLYQVALVAVLGAILIVALAPRLDTDFWWHLKDGQYISLHHVVPSADFMSYTLRGHAWTDHEWLAEVWLYALYRIAGLWGPIAFFAITICAMFSLVYLRMLRMGVNQVLALFVMAAAFIASSASWGPRIQMLTLFFLAFYMLLLQRFGVTRDRRLLFVFPGLMLIWANVHGGFVLGLAAIGLTLLGEGLNRWTHRDGAWSVADLKLTALSLLGTGTVTMINPNGVRQLLYPLTFVLPNAYTNLIEESASPNFHLPVMMVFEALLLLLVASVFVARPRVNWTHLLFVLAFTHLAFSQVRNVAVWAVTISPFVALYLQASVPALRELFPNFSYRRRPVRGRVGATLNLVLLALITVVYLVEATHFVNPTTLRQAERENYPTGAIAYMRTHTLPNHVFTSYGWGGYVLWNLFPRYSDYMDSRADTLFNNRILHGYLSAYAAKPDWRTVLRDNHVDLVLVERTAPLAQVLAQDPGWRLDYGDSASVLYQVR